MKTQARLRLAPGLLVDLLRLPEGTAIVGVEWQASPPCVVLTVDHPSIAGRDEVEPIVRYRDDGQLEFVKW